MSLRRFIFCSDFHGDHHDPQSAKAVLSFCKKWKPHVRVFGGDLWDFRAIRKGANEEERRDSMLKDYADGMQFLKEYRPHFFIRGNHDERLWDLAETDKGMESDLARKCVAEVEGMAAKLHCRMIPYESEDGVLRLGKLAMLHGYAHGIGAARKQALVYGHSMFGHGHAIDSASTERHGGAVGMMVGSLCNRKMKYNRGQIGKLRQENGFGYGGYDEKTGDYWAGQARRLGDRFVCATELTEL